MNATKVKSLIGKELWAETNCASVKMENFDNAKKAITKLKTIEEKQEFKDLCKEDVLDNSNPPVIPSFLYSVMGKHPFDDTYILSLFDEYYKISMYDEAEYIGQTILSFNESPYILTALADIYEKKNDINSRIMIWKRLIKADPKNTDMLYLLAEHYTETGDEESALNCYKQALQRHINAGELHSLKDLWPKILESEKNVNYLIQVSTKIAKTMGADKGVFFLNEILNVENLDLNSKIMILKKILSFSNNNKDATDKLIPLLREKYADNPRLDYCLADTGLLNSYMDSNIAVQKFENEIEFIVGAFVYHNTWHLGRIKQIDKDEMFIQFLSKKELHKMSCNMAFSSLKILPKQHILVLKAGASPEKIKEHLMNNTEWGLKMLMNSYPEGITMKQMKAELCPSILNAKDWSAWWTEAKNVLSSNPYFGTSDISNDVYIMRDTPITYEEKTYGLFSREKGFFNKYSILKEFLKHGGNTDSEEFENIIKYFEKEIKTTGFAGISSFLILKELKNRQGIGSIKLDYTFEELYGPLSIADIQNIYNDILDNDLKKSFVSKIIETDTGAKLNKILTALLYSSPSSFIAGNLSKRSLDNIRRNAVDNYQSDTDFILWLLKYTTEEEWKGIGLDTEGLIILKLQILLFVNGKISHGVDTAQNKMRSKQLTDTLFGGELNAFLGSCNTEQARRVYSYIENIPELDDDKKFSIKHFILSNRKDANEIVNVPNIDLTNQRMIPKGFLCTKKMLDIKTVELDHIMNVEIPENAKQIGLAREMGDLRENAEYQYTRDKQKNLNAMMNRLSDEIDSAKVIAPETVDTSYVEFGTKVTFKDNINGKQVVYNIFGAWESNPEKNILNFQAPLGLKLYNMQLGENKKFVINDVPYDYTVEKIELADFNL